MTSFFRHMVEYHPDVPCPVEPDMTSIFRNMIEYRYGVLSVRMTPLVLHPLHERQARRRLYRLEKPFVLWVTSRCGHLDITVPAGFRTDLASIPIILQPFVGPADSIHDAAVIHDLACSAGWPRFAANALLRIVMEAQGYSAVKTLAIYYAVMIFGYASLPSRIFSATVGKVWALLRRLFR